MPEPSLTNQVGLVSTVTVGSDGLSSPRAINREIWTPDQYPLADTLLEALRELLEDVPKTKRRDVLVDKYGVHTSLSTEESESLYTAYARLASKALEKQSDWFQFVKTTRCLGMSTDYGNSSLDDVFNGPIRILAAANTEPPKIEIDLSNFFGLRSNQRTAILHYLFELSAGVELRITASYGDQRRLLENHREQLPASVIESAESSIHEDKGCSTRTEQRRKRVRKLLADRPEGHQDWKRLRVVYNTPRERISYDTLEDAPSADFSSRSGVRQWVHRMSSEDLVEAYGSPHNRQVRLLPTGYALLDEHSNNTNRSDRTVDDTSEKGSVEQTPARGEKSDSVSDPPNSSDSSVYPPVKPEGREEGATFERKSVEKDEKTSEVDSFVKVEYLQGWEHDAAVSAAKAGEIALCERDVDFEKDSRRVGWSFLEDRDEVVVRVEQSGWASLTLVRLCSALLSEPALDQVLTRDRLAAQSEYPSLKGLTTTNEYVLRNGACLGYLKDSDSFAGSYRRRLQTERDDLLARTREIKFGNNPDKGEIAQLARDAHGLAGTVTRIYDMLGIDVTRVLEVPRWAIETETRREHLLTMIGKQTSISSRYGIYSAERVLHEPRQGKREQLLGSPKVEKTAPAGDVIGSWVLVGGDVDELDTDLELLRDDLDLQEDAVNFSAFILDLNVVDGNHRTSYALALSRRTSLRNLETTQQAISMLQAFSSDVFAAAKGLSFLGSEDESRELDLYDIRSALSFLQSEELIPEIGTQTVSTAFQVLLDANQPLSTSELADLSEVTTQTLRNNTEAFDQLEAAGVLERTTLGCGKPTEWRVQLPYQSERRTTSEPTPEFVVGRTSPIGGEWTATEAIGEILIRLGDEWGYTPVDYRDEAYLTATSGPIDERDLDILLERYPQHQPLVQLVVELLESGGRTVSQRETQTARVLQSVRLGRQPHAGARQSRLETTAD